MGSQMELDAFGANAADEWLAAGAVTIAVFVALYALERIAVAYTERGPQAGAATTGRAFVARLERGTGWDVFLVIALFAGSRLLTMPDQIDNITRGALIITVLWQIAWWGSVSIDFWTSWYLQRDVERAVAGALDAGRYIGKLLIWTLLLVIALDNIGVEVTTVITGLGIGGIAIALAAQGILRDLFASIAIVLDRPFRTGDFVVVDDMWGTVDRVGVKTTRMTSLDGEQLVFGNDDLLAARIRNYGKMETRRALFTFGVTYDTPTELVEAIPGMVREAIEAQPSTRFERAHFRGYGESALEIEAVYHVLSSAYEAYMDAQQAINLQLLRRFRDEGIEFAFPTRTLRVYGEPLSLPSA